ncbi:MULTISPECIES: AraC family transcriptional regulator [unclassified Mycolicibacterium]|uniref:AraC family transcriptional regulator n=2 Tax=Mycolicibacterium TaxID=1866885 RepID=UPI0028169B61|nr:MULTISPECIES: AraC family transcriptional regulator [unclassified Mycolicibacterium]
MQGPDRESVASIPTSVLINVVEVAERAGLPAQRWLAAAGLSAQAVTSPDARVSFRQAAIVLRHAVRAMSGGLGIDVGSRDMYVSFGVLGLAIRSAENLGAAIQIGIELHQSAGSLMDVDGELAGESFALRAYERSPEPELLPFLCEELFCSVLVTFRTVLEDPSLSPEYVQVSYPAPDYAHRYREFFGCPVFFNADANRMALPAGMLSRTMPRADAATHAVAVAACRDMLGKDDQPNDLVHTVETMLRDSLRDPLTMAQIAKRLGITDRTLRRRLGAGGQQFAALRDKVRSERARYLVRETTLPIHAIAAEVGFTDPREFRRAYRKWTGHPPTHDR